MIFSQKPFLILYPSLENSTTVIAIITHSKTNLFFLGFFRRASAIRYTAKVE